MSTNSNEPTTGPEVRKIEFQTSATAPPPVFSSQFLQACAEAARKEAEAETIEIDGSSRIPLELLIETGQVSGPYRREQTNEGLKLTPMCLPLDSGENEIGKPARIFILPKPNEPLVEVEIDISAISPGEIAIRERGKKKGTITQKDGIYLGKKGTKFAGDTRTRLYLLNKENRLWDLETFPSLNLEPDSADDSFFAKLRPGDSVKDEPFRAAFRLVTRPHKLCGIKGPPGTGKTHLVGLAATKLANLGFKCLLVSKSHKAIENALREIAVTAKRCVEINADKKVPRIAKRTNDGLSKACIEAGIVPLKAWVKEPEDKGYRDPWAQRDIIGITADSAMTLRGKGCHLNQHPFDIYPADFLFYEEAGQTPTFTVAALHGMAKNMVLLGDEDQLAPIVRATHSTEMLVGESALSFLQQTHPERVLALPVTHRLSGPICSEVSRIYYPELIPPLKPGRGEQSKVISPTRNESQGIFFHQIDHSHLKKSAPLEREAIVEMVKLLLGSYQYQETPEDAPRPLTAEDFCVLAPFRLQSNLIGHMLREETGQEILTGTIHKLQGQGRPVVLASLCASNLQFLSNTAEWLFAPNMWNVTVSRAKAICIVFGNLETLKACRPKTLKGITFKAQMLGLLEGRRTFETE